MAEIEDEESEAVQLRFINNVDPYEESAPKRNDQRWFEDATQEDENR